jgi:hypothetical protein
VVLKGVVLLGAWIDGWVDEQDPIRLNQRSSNCIGFLCSLPARSFFLRVHYITLLAPQGDLT